MFDRFYHVIKNNTSILENFPEYDTTDYKKIATDLDFYEDKPINEQMKITFCFLGSNGAFVFTSCKTKSKEKIVQYIKEMQNLYDFPYRGTFIFIRTPEQDYFFNDDDTLFELTDTITSFENLFHNTQLSLVDTNKAQWCDYKDMLSKAESSIPDDNEKLSVPYLGKTAIKCIKAKLEKEQPYFEVGDLICDKNGNKYRKFNTKVKYLGYSYKEEWYPVANDDPQSFFLMTLLGGWFGLHKYKCGDIKQGLLYTLTFGGFGIFYAFDLLQMIWGNYSITQINYEETPDGKLIKKKSKVFLDRVSKKTKLYSPLLIFAATLFCVIGINMVYLPVLSSVGYKITYQTAKGTENIVKGYAEKKLQKDENYQNYSVEEQEAIQSLLNEKSPLFN